MDVSKYFSCICPYRQISTGVVLGILFFPRKSILLCRRNTCEGSKQIRKYVDKSEFICYYNGVKLIRQFVCTILSLNKTRTNYQNMNSKLQLDYFRDNFAHWHGYKVPVLFLYRKLLWNSIYSKNRRTLCFNLNQKDTRTGDMNYVHFKNRSKF